MSIQRCALVVFGIVGAAHGQAIFTWCGSIPNGQWIGVKAVAADGAAVIGTANFPAAGGATIGRAFRWTPATGIVNLGTLPSSLTYPYSDSLDVSADGSIVVGDSFTSSLRAFRWAGGTMAELPMPPGGTGAMAVAVSSDAAAIVGSCTIQNVAHVVRWTAGGVQDVGAAPFRTYSVPWAASSDGSVVAGYAYSTFGADDRGFVLDALGWADVGVLPGMTQSRVYALSGDGTVATGYCRGTAPNPALPFLWTRAGGIQPLPFPPRVTGVTPLGVSGDGSVIVGAISDVTADPDGFVWTRWAGTRSVRDVLQGYGVDLTGVVGVRVSAVTDDGCTLAGTAGGPNEYRAWIATLPPGFGCYGNCDGSTVAPVLNVADFICFLNRFSAGDPGANCDGSTAAPTLNIADFVCFLDRFVAGCP